MVTIPHGVIGLSASKWKTGLGHRSELEAAQTHLPPMEEHHVQDLIMSRHHAIHRLVLEVPFLQKDLYEVEATTSQAQQN